MKIKISALIFLLIIVAIAVTGCMREKEVCNYDSVCTENETDNCADCAHVMGRDIAEPTSPEQVAPLGANNILH